MFKIIKFVKNRALLTLVYVICIGLLWNSKQTFNYFWFR